jgi:YebC/PmpR family DNA-binding regulatory protein
MSGHSKWSTIKHKKAITDARRSKSFSKLTHDIMIATKNGGADVEKNFRLRLADQKAKAGNLPNENIERSIKKATGQLGGAQLEELTFEAVGPENVNLLIFALTDNKNRTLPEIKNTVEKSGFKMVASGAVSWAFKQVGVIKLEIGDRDREEIELKLIDVGAQDIIHKDDLLLAICDINKIEDIKKILEEYKIIDFEDEIEWISENQIEGSEELQIKLADLESKLAQIDGFSEMATNLKIL